jgi:hypothetical protein
MKHINNRHTGRPEKKHTKHRKLNSHKHSPYVSNCYKRLGLPWLFSCTTLVYESSSSSSSIKVQQSNISKSQFTSQMQKHHITCPHSHKSVLRGEMEHCTHTKKGTQYSQLEIRKLCYAWKYKVHNQEYVKNVSQSTSRGIQSESFCPNDLIDLTAETNPSLLMYSSKCDPQVAKFRAHGNM